MSTFSKESKGPSAASSVEGKGRASPKAIVWGSASARGGNALHNRTKSRVLASAHNPADSGQRTYRENLMLRNLGEGDRRLFPEDKKLGALNRLHKIFKIRNSGRSFETVS